MCVQLRQIFSSTQDGCFYLARATREKSSELASRLWNGSTSSPSTTDAPSNFCTTSAVAVECSKIGTLFKTTFASAWDLHSYPIRAAEISLDCLNTYIADPLIGAATLTKNYFQNHYGEVLVHVVAWSVIFALCGFLGTRGLSGLNTITKPMLIGFGPGFLVGVLGGIVAARAGLKYNPETGGFAEKIQKASDNPFLKAAGGATYMLTAATIPAVIGAFTGAFLGYKIVEHIVDFPEPTPTTDERISQLEEAVSRLQNQRKSELVERADAAARLREAANLLEHGHPPVYNQEVK